MEDTAHLPVSVVRNQEVLYLPALRLPVPKLALEYLAAPQVEVLVPVLFHLRSTAPTDIAKHKLEAASSTEFSLLVYCIALRLQHPCDNLFSWLSLQLDHVSLIRFSGLSIHLFCLVSY